MIVPTGKLPLLEQADHHVSHGPTGPDHGDTLHGVLLRRQLPEIPPSRLSTTIAAQTIHSTIRAIKLPTGGIEPGHWACPEGPPANKIMVYENGRLGRVLGVGSLKVLVIGKGGREHALCWKLKQSPRVQAVFCAPGNAGTALEAQNVSIEPNDTRGLIQFAKREGIGLTVVGPEEPLVLGIVDAFRREGLRIFGPRKDAAELEGSKVFAKELMRQAGIPTAESRIFRSAPDAEHYVLSREVSLVVRSKGRSTLRHTLLCRTAAETLEAIDRIMDPREQLGPGVQVEIEERSQRRVFDTAAEARDYVLGRPLGHGDQGRRTGRRQGGDGLR